MIYPDHFRGMTYGRWSSRYDAGGAVDRGGGGGASCGVGALRCFPGRVRAGGSGMLVL